MTEVQDAVETQETDTTQVETQVPQIDEDRVAAKVAGTLLNQTRQDAARLTQQQMPTAVQAEYQYLKSLGYSDDALDAVARMAIAAQKDALSINKLQLNQKAGQDFNESIWDMVDDSFEKFADQLEILTYAEVGIKQRFHELSKVDKEFTEKVKAGIKPTAKVVNAVMAKAVDEFCKKAGLERSEPPVNLSTKKAPQTPGSKSGVASLDQNQRKLFNALKGTFGEEMALTQARSLYDEE